MELLSERFIRAAQEPCDINEHIPYLHDLASRVIRVTEFGTRLGISTTAFLMAKPLFLRCYDIYRQTQVDELLALANIHSVCMEFHLKDVLTVDIEHTDMLFIDTFHVEAQLAKELERHHEKVIRYIVLHDTETFGEKGEDPAQRGLNYALHPFLKKNPQWKIADHRPNNNGLTVLERKTHADR